jgi:hypothetical protein
MSIKATNSSASRLRSSGLNRSIIGASALGSMGATLMTANAAIVPSGLRNLSTSTQIGDVFDPDVEPVNIDGVGVDEFSLYSFFSKGSDFHWLSNAAPDFRPHTIEPIYGNSPTVRMAAGEIVGPSTPFSDYNTGVFLDNQSSTEWTGGSNGYFGFRFNPTGSQNLYGWGRMSFSPDAKIMTLVDWAYENTGAPIKAGVPEPTTGLLLLMSLFFAAFWRRK